MTGKARVWVLRSCLLVHWLRNVAISTFLTSSDEHKWLQWRFQERIEQMWRLKECVCGILHFALCVQTPQSEQTFPRVQVDGSEGRIKAGPQRQLDISRERLWLAHLPSSMKADRSHCGLQQLWTWVPWGNSWKFHGSIMKQFQEDQERPFSS